MKNVFLKKILIGIVVGGAWGAWAEGVPSEDRTVSLSECEKRALAQHPSVRLAAQETALARQKKFEARRALGPELVLKGEYTDGAALPELGSPGFREESYGVQGSQPVFQGRRLYNVYRQSKASWESVKAREEKTRQAVLYTVREAFWNLVKARRSTEIFRISEKNLKENKDKSDVLIKKDMIPSRDFHEVETEYYQGVLEREGAEADQEARLWQWTAALGLLSPPPEIPPADIPEIKNETPFTLAFCLERATQVHPDLLFQRKATEAAYYGELAGKSIYYPKLSVNGSYGRSGGAFDSEPLSLREDWLIGFQASQYFGGNSLNVSGFDQRTSPKIGQTNRTEAKTISGSLGLLDSTRQTTEKEEASLMSDQSRVQLDQTIMDVANGVRDAYAEWKKSIARLHLAEHKRALAKSEWTIATIKGSRGETPWSERCVKRNEWARAESFAVEARALHHISQAGLCRAVGDPNLFEAGQQ